MPQNLSLNSSRSTNPAERTPTSAPASKSLTEVLGRALRATSQPRPILRPEVNRDLTALAAYERLAEVLRYNILQVEYSLSSDGTLRAWLRLIVLVALFLAIPALFVVPIVTWLLRSFTAWSTLLFQLAQNLLYVCLAVGAAVLVVIALHFLTVQYAAHARKRRFPSNRH